MGCKMSYFHLFIPNFSSNDNDKVKELTGSSDNKKAPTVKEPNRSSVEFESTPRSSDLYQQESEEDDNPPDAVDDVEEDCHTYSIDEDVQEDHDKKEKDSSHSESASEIEEELE